MAQAKLLQSQQLTVIKALDLCDGDLFDNIWYWTSTQGTNKDGSILNAINISLTEGRASETNKLNQFAVRPIITIK